MPYDVALKIVCCCDAFRWWR